MVYLLKREVLNLPRLKRMGQRNITVVGLNPPDRRIGIMHALNTNSSVSGACPRMYDANVNQEIEVKKGSFATA